MVTYGRRILLGVFAAMLVQSLCSSWSVAGTTVWNTCKWHDCECPSGTNWLAWYDWIETPAGSNKGKWGEAEHTETVDCLALLGYASLSVQMWCDGAFHMIVHRAWEDPSGGIQTAEFEVGTCNFTHGTNMWDWTVKSYRYEGSWRKCLSSTKYVNKRKYPFGCTKVSSWHWCYFPAFHQLFQGVRCSNGGFGAAVGTPPSWGGLPWNRAAHCASCPYLGP